MSKSIKIAIIGDYNFTYNSHQATNLAIDHSGRFLELEISYYWIKINEAALYKPQQFEQYDGIWFSPGASTNLFFLHGIIRAVSQLKIPTLLTGESFKSFIEVLVNNYQLNPGGEKLISDNLVDGNQFEKVSIVPHSKEFIQLYENHNTIELTSSRYSMYPKLIQVMVKDLIDIEAYNQFEDPEVISLKKHDFFVACGYCPQISSTREIPHPLIYTFIKACLYLNENSLGKLA